MKLAHFHLPLLLLMLPIGSALAAQAKKFPSYSMVLMGGGLSICSSAQESACATTPEWSDEAKKTELYLIQPNYIKNIINAENWAAERKPLLSQVAAMLQHLQSKLPDTPPAKAICGVEGWGAGPTRHGHT